MSSSSLASHLVPRPLSIFTLSLCLISLAAEAKRNTGVPECPAPKGNQYMIRDFTNYSPRGARGSMNGKCEQSNVYRDALDEKRGGPMKHGACHYELEDHLSGQTNAVMGAVPLRGKASNLLGAIYQGIALDKAIGASGIYIYVGDTYGRGWHTRECKMDIITKAVRSELTDKVNRARGGELIKLARGDIPSPSRKVPRDPAALETLTPLAKSEQKLFPETPEAGLVAKPNPRRFGTSEVHIPLVKPRYFDSTAGQASTGRWPASSTEDINSYYDRFTLNPPAAPKTNSPHRKPASQAREEGRLKNLPPERLGH